MRIFDARPVVLGSAIAMILSFAIIPGYAQEEEFVFDNAPDMDNWSTGPEVGETIPAIVGVDQHGNAVSFDDIKGPNGAYIVFHRSADWWPFCKTQLVQLEQSYDDLVVRGLGVVAISYDTVEILQAFAERKGPFRYTMIADSESKVIEAFDLRNPNTRSGTRVYGMAFPGTYIVDENGVVQEKFFNISHRQRLTVDSVLMSVFGGGEAGDQRVEADIQSQFKMVAFLSEEEVQPGNQIVLVAEFDLYDDVHLYAPGSDYHAVDLVLDDNPMLQAGELRLPEPEIMYLDVIDESVPVYHGKVRITRKITLSPGFEGDALEVGANLEYQTCDDEYCFEPSSLPLTFNLKVSAHDRQRAPEGVRHQ